ncbi:hypothetical protein FACS189464_2220 [Bacteroidia bacterium]|nr:hypothetical protein FACS189464_2220 [Bacteroidia bacterium]
MNVNELNSFVFSIIDCDIVTIKNYLEKQEYDYKIVYENINIEDIYFHNMYLKPIKGIAKALFYNPDIAPQLTIGLGNGRGCWGTLCNNISANLSVNNIQMELNTKDSDITRNQFRVYDGRIKGYTREVQRILGDNNRMEFVNSGEPLWFENTEYYKKRKITDRINKNILMEYANKIGIDLGSNELFETTQKSLYVEL